MSATFDFVLRTRSLELNSDGRNVWTADEAGFSVDASKLALVLCDVWDSHYSRGARERLELMVSRMNDVVTTARDKGAKIIHSPSGTMNFYSDSPARKRMQEFPRIEPPPPQDHADPPLPIDDTQGGSDTNETDPVRAYSREHPSITIDQDRDVISDDGDEVYSFLQHTGCEMLLIMGVHTNMCVLNRSFAIKQMVRRGQNVALISDLTDTMYDPAKSPYVSHEQGTDLVVHYIESFWCPTIQSDQLMA